MCHTLILTLFTVLPHEASAARTLPGDVVTVSAILTLAYQCTVLSIEPQRTSCKGGKDSRVRRLLREPERSSSNCLCLNLKDAEPLESE